MADSFPPWTTRVRKDPFGASGYYRLALERFRWVERIYSAEHIEVAGASAGTAGEHNAPEIPREVGSVELVAGPLYTNHNFRYSSTTTRTALGTATVNLNSAVYSSIYEMSVQLQNCSETGINKPCISSYVTASTSAIAVYHQSLSSALGAGNTWAAEDSGFALAIHGAPLGSGGWLPISSSHIRGESVTEATTDLNATVQADVDLRAMFLVDHNSSGVHTCREVAKTWAHIGVHSGGGVYDILDSSARNPCTASTWVSAGICELTFSNAWTLDAQPFVMPDYQQLNGGSESDLYCCVTPRSFITTTKIRVYTYKYTSGSPGTWARADTDFFVAIHAG